LLNDRFASFANSAGVRGSAITCAPASEARQFRRVSNNRRRTERDTSP